MSTVDEKLQRGFTLAAQSDGHADLLGVAMVAFHSALEDHLDEVLSHMTQIDQPTREILAAGRIGWLQRANLALEYELITREQRQMILDVNRLRQEFAHGLPFNGSVESVETYGRFVSEICGRAAPQPRRARRTARAADGATIPASGRGDAPTVPITAPAEAAWRDRTAARRARRPDLLTLFPIQQIALLLTVVLAIGVGGWILFDWILAPPAPAAVSGLPELSTVPSPQAPVATPTPREQRAQIARLGGAVGWLRERPSFTAATLPIRLTDGMEVTLLSSAPVDAEGATWRQVAAGGYEGWCPVNNLELVDASAPAP